MIENPTEEQLRTLRGIVYMMLNKINGKMYIGVTIDSFRGRYGRIHQNTGSSRMRKYLRRAINKYGFDNFEIKLLEYGIEDETLLDFLEVFYICIFNSMAPNGYNFESGGSKNKKASLESRNRMTNAQYKRFRKERKIVSPSGKIHTFFNVKKFAEKHGINRQKLSSVLTGRIKHVGLWRLIGTELPTRKTHLVRAEIQDKYGNKYYVNNAKKFAKEHDISHQGLCAMIRGIFKTCGDFRLLNTPLEYDRYDFTKSKKHKKYKAVKLEKDKKIYYVDNFNQFAIENKFNLSCLYAVIKGVYKTIKGFSLVEIIYNN